MKLQKLTQTWGERMASEARSLVARHAPHAPSVAWLGDFVRRRAPGPTPAHRFVRVEPGAKRVPDAPVEEGALIPADVRERLRDVIGPSIERARVHTGDAADAIAREHAADAVTIGDHILFRDGQYRPHEPRGLALLAHEATHVVEGAAPAGRATSAGIFAEESRARSVEATVLAAQKPAAFTGPAAAPTPSRSVVTASTPGATPMTAASDRAVEASTPSTQGFDVAELKRSIYRDLLQTIRSDAERGG